MAEVLSENVYEMRVRVAEDPRSVCVRAERIFSEQRGFRERLIKGLLGRRQVSSDTFEVVGRIGSGFFELNPAQVTVVAAADEYGGSKVKIRGVAKEGLVKQHAGEKAARRFASLLQ